MIVSIKRSYGFLIIAYRDDMAYKESTKTRCDFDPNKYKQLSSIVVCHFGKLAVRVMWIGVHNFEDNGHPCELHAQTACTDTLRTNP